MDECHRGSAADDSNWRDIVGHCSIITTTSCYLHACARRMQEMVKEL